MQQYFGYRCKVFSRDCPYLTSKNFGGRPLENEKHGGNIVMMRAFFADTPVVPLPS
jgi:hypothetical protein